MLAVSDDKKQTCGYYHCAYRHPEHSSSCCSNIYGEFSSGTGSGKKMSPTELVLKSGCMKEIQNMLDDRWKHGWKLDRIIDHGPKTNEQYLIVYYFIRRRGC